MTALDELRKTTTSSRKSWFRRHRWWMLVVVCSFAGGYVVRLMFPSWAIDTVYRAVRVLAPSPAAAGVAAVLAASIAAIALSRQLAHDKAVERDKDWWRAFEWAVSRALPTNPNERSLPYVHSVNTLTALRISATNAVQEQACSGLLTHLSELDNAHPTEQGAASANSSTPGQSDTAAEALLLTSQAEQNEAKIQALSQYVLATKGTNTRSFGAEAHLYELRVIKALNDAAASSGGDIEMLTSETGSEDMGFDALVSVRNTPVIVEIKQLRRQTDRAGGRILRNQLASYLQTYALGNARALLVTTVAVDVSNWSEDGERRLANVVWTSPADNSKLLEALQSLGDQNSGR
jgi:hypothetical protein